MLAAERFRYASYTVRMKVFKLFGGSFDVYAPDGSMVLFANKKAFKLKEDIRLYSGKDMEQELLLIKARSIVDFSAAYDVHDTAIGERVGVLKRRGLKALARDQWTVMDAAEREIGTITEDSQLLGLVRRLLAIVFINFIPQRYHCEIEGEPACSFLQNANPFVTKVHLEYPAADAAEPRLDKRMALAAAVLLCTIEGKQGVAFNGI